MVKPFDAMELSLRLSNLLDHKRIVDSLEEGARVMVMMARTIEARDKYTAGHSERVAKFAADMGRELRLSPREILTLEQGGLVHDIGKVGIRDNLLLKPGALTTEERLEFQLHPGIGVRMIESLRTQSHLLPVIHHHHERMDGSGYPDHLSGDGIPLLARITAYADVFDAVSSLRPYRPAYSVRDSVEIVRHEASRRLLDPELLGVFETVVARIGDAPVGLL
jgi:putative two-component system response regulator